MVAKLHHKHQYLFPFHRVRYVLIQLQKVLLQRVKTLTLALKEGENR